jgi:hypothetical protein
MGDHDGREVARRTMRAKKTFFLALSSLAFALVTWGPAMADGINGFVELNYNTLDTTTRDSTGLTTQSKQSSILERYNLNLERAIYPYLKLRAGGLFEKTVTNIATDDTDTRSADTKIIPSIDLTLKNPFVTAGAGYNKIEEKQETRGLPSLTTIRDTYNALFGLRPEGLPTLDTLFMRTDTYDRSRLLQNNKNDFFSLSSRYLPVKDLDLRYQFTSNDAKDRLTDVDVKVLTQTGRATYSSQFFNNRISLYSSYNISHQETDITSGVGGNVPLQLFPFFGLSAINDTPSMGALNPNPALIDGDLTASSGINIGQPSIPGNDTRFRNMGLDFVNSTEVNTLFVKVDPTIVMPVAVAASFTWDVYTSPDNLTWNHVQTIFPAPFDPFEHRFEINFSNVTTRYLKVVTQPLGVGVSVPTGFDRSNINITELQAFITTPATTGTIKRTTQIYELSTRVRLLDNPYLNYDFYYWHTKTDPTGLTRYIMSNGLTLSQRLSRVFTGNARIAREDGEETAGKRVSYVYSASLMAIPLPTLSHSLVVSGRSENIAGQSSDTRSVFLNNTAELYRGVNVNLSGGVNSATSETKRKTDNTVLTFGASLVPYRTMTISVSYSDTATKQSGGGMDATSTYSRRGDASVAFNPWATVYLFSSIGVVSENDKKTSTVQNYAGTWSPFPGGSLQFNFSYNENLRSDDNGKDTIITPSIRWNIIPRTVLDVSYLILRSESLSESSTSKSFNMNLKMFF